MESARHTLFTLFALALMLGATALYTNQTDAAERRVGDIRNTKHNLSFSGGQDVRSRSLANSGTEEVCVFCHTPHGASSNPGQPLWNRADSAANYTMYGSSSLNATASMAVAPTEQSKLCLSCHDGTLAIGALANAPGSGSGTAISEYGFDDVKVRMRHDSGPTPNTGVGGMAQVPNVQTDTATPSVDSLSGFTRNLGVDLSNDHPISFPYTTALADADGELRDPSSATHIDSGAPGARPIYPLTGDNMQCTTCHDPHVKGQDIPSGTTVTENNSKFLRGPRFQMSVPSGISFQQGVFDPATGNAQSGDIVCLACHDRELNAGVWAKSSHADPDVADQQYLSSASDLRQFPSGIKVWQASCLNCHDTHSVAGSRRLLREGTDGSLNADGAKSGGKAAQEETCFQCHTDGVAGSSILDLNTGTGTVPNIKHEFTQRTYHMPLDTDDQRNAGSRGGTGEELHDITSADMDETGANLGKGNDRYRHAECTDCHNPHRLRRNNRFNSDGLINEVVDGGVDSTTLRTHVAGLNATSLSGSINDGREGNVASGVLRGAWGVEPTDTFLGTSLGTTWPESMTENDFEVRSGDPGVRTVAQADTAKNMTREYQLCFKCHSSYSMDMRSGTKNETTVNLGGHGGSTGSNTNGLSYFTNVAAEFLSVDATNPPTSGTDQGEWVNDSGGSASDPCGGDCDPSAAPGHNGALNQSGGNRTNNHRSWHPVVFPTGRNRDERGMPATGSINLLAPFADNIGTQTMYCSDCHGADGSWTAGTGPNGNVQGPHGSNNTFLLRGSWNPASATPNNPAFCGNCHSPVTRNSGFDGASEAWHGFNDKDDGRCGFCHIAVPHGWKNKAFLVNLNCVGPEGGLTGECNSIANGDLNSNNGYRNAPYYWNAKLKIGSWSESSGWAASNCSGVTWMQDQCGSW